MQYEGNLVPGKAYKQRDPFAPEKARYWGVSKKRLSNAQILAAAGRFEKDGEFENANAMLELMQ